MKNLKIGVLLLALLMAFALIGCGNDDEEISEDTIAVVNGEGISRESFEQVLAMYKIGYEAEFGEEIWDTPTDSGETILEGLKNEVSRILILEQLVTQRAGEENLTVEEEELDEGIKPYLVDPQMQKLIADGTMDEDFVRGQLRKEILAQKYQEWYLSENEVTEEEIEEFYEANKEVFEILEVQARHILVEDRELAEDLIDRIEAGESFEELAMEYSIDGSAQRGGDLGYFGRGEMVGPFDEASFSQEVGEVSAEPIESQFGYHIILVEDRVDDTESLEEVSDSIRSHIGNQRFQTHMSELYEEADIQRSEDL